MNVQFIDFLRNSDLTVWIFKMYGRLDRGADNVELKAAVIADASQIN